MKISLTWLNRYLDKPVTADEVDQAVMSLGFPVDKRELKPGGDEMLDVEVTSNRPDCLSHIGVAREVAAKLGRMLVLPPTELETLPAGPEAASLTSVELREPALCPLYTARVIQGVRVGPSPSWLVSALETIGLRSVNNVVDITNYVLMETGQPLHAFDMAKLDGRRIVVRRASEGEAFTAIDSSKHRLSDSMLVIADASKPVAVAGVMGGIDSEVGPASVDILLESAIFKPLPLRMTSRRLKLASDASYRYERGIDPCGVPWASARAARLIIELAGGRLASGIVRQGQADPNPISVSLRPDRCRAIIGLDIPTDRIVSLLDQLGLSPKLSGDSQRIECLIPTFRLDLLREIDLIEEVARLNGLEHLGVADKISIAVRPAQPGVQGYRSLRQALVGQGYLETVSFSFIPPALGQPFVPAGQQALMIDDDRRKKEPMLRPSLLPSLLVCRKANQDAGTTDLKLCEMASAWLRSQAGDIQETHGLALIADVTEASPASTALRDMRGTIEELIERLTGQPATIRPAASQTMAPAADVFLGDLKLGSFGLMTSALQKLFDLQSPVVMAELQLDPLVMSARDVKKLTAIPRFPAIERDLSLVMDEAIAWQTIEAEVVAQAPALMETVQFVTAYRGKPIPAGQKSVTLRLIFRDPKATLRHEQVDGQVADVVTRLTQKLQAQLRS